MTDMLVGLSAALADRYRIERELGQGGMATVYLAQDLKHGRQVAVKVLRPELAAMIGAERFLSEIRTTAALQHPHILPLFDSGTVSVESRESRAEGRTEAIRDPGPSTMLFYVMPFVEGESLRDRLNREKQLPIADAVRIATEVASALDYAHRHSVIHRDIKPENILLHDGQALVADFGIALAASKAGGSRMTETGMSLGTPHYMSPEQAMGEREITARSDVYALGCVTYEMLVGEPPFTGPTAQSIVAKVMTAEPAPLIQQRKTIPPAVEDAVLTALQKLPADRWSTAAEFAAALGGQADGRTGGRTRAQATSPHPPVPTSPLILALLGVAIVTGLWGWLRPQPAAPPLTFGRAHKVTSDPGLEIQPAISPDGRSVAYAAGTTAETRVYVRPVSGGRPIAISDNSGGRQSLPRWSPDGSRVLFLSQNGVFSAPASGGPSRQELPAGNGSLIRSADWSPDGTRLAYVIGDSIFIREADGRRHLVALAQEPALCIWSPQGEALACAAGNFRYLMVGQSFGNLASSRIVICRVSDGRVTTVTDSTALNQAPIWSADGQSVYFISSRQGPRDIYAQRIGRDGRASGPPVRLTVGLGAQSISLSRDGRTLAYAAFNSTANIWSLPLPTGAPISVAQAVPVTHGNQVIENVRVSKDGIWLLYDSDLNGTVDLYRIRASGGEPERLTTDSTDEFAPDPSPDGKEIAFHSWRSGSRNIYILPLDGGPQQQVTSSPLQEGVVSWAPDGSGLVYMEVSLTGGIWTVRRAPDRSWGTPMRRLPTGFWPNWSPDGKQISSTTREFGGNLSVMPADSGPSRLLTDVSRQEPSAEGTVWSHDGKTIYFKSHDAKGAASIWSIPSAGGTPWLLVRFDDPLRPSDRYNWAMGNNRIYFPIDDRQSDVWVMDVTPH